MQTRSKVRILCDILETVKHNGNVKKSTIIRLANLDWNMANKYLNTLMEEDYLETYENDNARGGKNYQLTDDGKEFLYFLRRAEDRSSIF